MASNGTNIVRSPDGIHFCPYGHSGTWLASPDRVTGFARALFRFALAMVSAITQYAYSTPGYK